MIEGPSLYGEGGRVAILERFAKFLLIDYVIE